MMDVALVQFHNIEAVATNALVSHINVLPYLAPFANWHSAVPRIKFSVYFKSIHALPRRTGTSHAKHAKHYLAPDRHTTPIPQSRSLALPCLAAPCLALPRLAPPINAVTSPDMPTPLP
jgi:hypothetical protein